MYLSRYLVKYKYLECTALGSARLNGIATTVYVKYDTLGSIRGMGYKVHSRIPLTSYMTR